MIITTIDKEQKKKNSIIDSFNEPAKVIQCYHSNQTDCI